MYEPNANPQPNKSEEVERSEEGAGKGPAGGRDDPTKGENAEKADEPPEEKADRELLDNETRKDAHGDDSNDPHLRDFRLGHPEDTQ